ncbi:MAG: panthothenate synthetase [Acidobacteriota bacterium]|nr:panthothenate synthetase [Acidobacteriota bacterium]
MRMLMKVTLPVEPFNSAVRDGSIAAKMGAILAANKPEAAYFTDFDGQRTGILILDMADVAQIPTLAEPWFLTFNAAVQFHPTMTPEDLARSGLESLGKQWS